MEQILIYSDNGKAVDTITGSSHPGLNTTYWQTWDQSPGTYKIMLKTGKTEIVKHTSLAPAIIYPTMNYK